MIASRISDLQPAAVFVERHLLHGGGDALAADLDLEQRSFGGRFGWEIRGADRNSQRRAHRSASDLATRLPGSEHGITVARERALGRRESNQPARESLLLLTHERV